MSKRYAADYTNAVLTAPLAPVAKKIGSLMERLRSFRLLSEDMVYKRDFKTDYVPLLYRKHAAEMHSNCVFCVHLVKAGCHRQCMKCGLGKDTQCRPMLPGLIHCEAIYPYDEETLRIPWFYAEPCAHFLKLTEENYLRNFNVIFSPSATYNYEILESLERGILNGQKPCHVCASIDYGIYKKCSGQEDFHAYSPCRKISAELADFYQNRNSKSTTDTVHSTDSVHITDKEAS